MTGFLGTKTGRFYSRFADGRMYMEYEMEMEGQVMSMSSATNGDKTYSETKMDGAAVSASVMDGETNLSFCISISACLYFLVSSPK